MDSIKAIKDYIEKNLSEKRRIHTEGVRKTAIELAKLYGADEKKAEAAALFHDMYRGLSAEILNHAFFCFLRSSASHSMPSPLL